MTLDMLSYSESRKALEANETSCAELVSYFSGKIDEFDPELNTFIEVDESGALERAAQLDAERRTGQYRPLTGMVVAVKDLICTTLTHTTCGSEILRGFRSAYRATVVERLIEAGAIIIGKTNCDEFAMGSSNESSCFGAVRNPLDVERVPGGSSGGSAAAVRAGFCHAALGSDTGGSIRQPAAFCGVVGLKPTYGLVSRYGLVAYASSFDCIGPIASTVDDARLLLKEISGHDSNDATSLDETIRRVPRPESPEGRQRSMTGLRVGLPEEYFQAGLSDEVRRSVQAAVAVLEQAGAELSTISMPHTRYGIAAYYVLTTAEASSNLSRFDGVRYGVRVPGAEGSESPLAGMYTATRSAGFGPEVRRRIMLGTYVLSAGYYDAYYARAQRVRTLIRQDFDRAFESVDFLITPTTPTTAFRLGEKTRDPLEMYLNDIYTVTANLAGIPGVSVPFGEDVNSLPVGVQLLGPALSEEHLLHAASVLESARESV
jgi:aspartyl-tRNA(Asn)/glutamyl-tRNA(Gln) amidotransferase subunit A